MAAAMGSPTLLGTIVVSGASKDNSDTAAPFAIPYGAMLLLQGDADFTFMTNSVAATAVTAGTGILVLDNATWPVLLKSDQRYVSCIGTASIKVFSLE